MTLAFPTRRPTFLFVGTRAFGLEFGLHGDHAIMIASFFEHVEHAAFRGIHRPSPSMQKGYRYGQRRREAALSVRIFVDYFFARGTKGVPDGLRLMSACPYVPPFFRCLR